jgi:anaerobic ribonucleoside-triphosphate reductase
MEIMRIEEIKEKIGEKSLINLLHDVLDKTTLKFVKYDPFKIERSLLKETCISEENCIKVGKMTTSYFIGKHLKITTAPMIREVVNSMLLQLGLEKERLQYTRIGMSYYDFKELIEKNGNNFGEKLIERAKTEFYNVGQLIEKLQGKEVKLKPIN